MMARAATRPMLSSVANALRVLEYLVETGEARVSEVGQELNVTVGTAHRLLGTLVATGFAEQNPASRRYRPSPKLLELANQMRSRLSTRDLAHNRLELLRTATGETANLAVLDDNRVLYVDKVFSDQTFGIEARIGARLPAYSTALGKVLLAYQDEEERERFIAGMEAERGAQAGNSPPEGAALRKKLAAVLKRGYAEDHGEFLPDVFCVAAPITNGRGHTIAAVSVSAPRSRFLARREQLILEVKAAASAISAEFETLGVSDLHS
jgi:DNA-binding IclR family transcriptional regulator